MNNIFVWTFSDAVGVFILILVAITLIPQWLADKIKRRRKK